MSVQVEGANAQVTLMDDVVAAAVGAQEASRERPGRVTQAVSPRVGMPLDIKPSFSVDSEA